MFAVNCVGDGRKRSGGLALLWQDPMQIHVQSFSIHHIDVLVDNDEHDKWRSTGIHGQPKDDMKHKTEELLERLAEEKVGPWVCQGDFNLMLLSCEKSGGGEFDVNYAKFFRRAVRSAVFETWAA